ncbi:protein MpACOS15 [Marchantia polymorpha subsp. ruderalis]|uniref:Carrier domain-containing protein n=2 Tax=Marchantia polymorpha TaxID=3197 RepID=A0AAF6B4X4_MARPO|nr:hypothetical protein MARPO_0066s0079 [Marchantia polymorpha]BBN07058.1 hypothetical protein Mp_4g00620 [Marchantia polymorpha subsp. ruderalis]|eukprot:PTQ36126.1 hypothetical protein MARPO_0066s0079 [Marchantia polymorpha]
MEDNSVVPLLRRVCKEGGIRLALVGTKDTSLTYEELGRDVRALSRHLRRTVGVRPKLAVGVCMDRRFDHIVTILGVLDAGAPYVPLDPSLPHRRLAYMINDSQLDIILTQRQFALDLESVLRDVSFSSKLVYLDGLIRHLSSSNEIEEDDTDTDLDPDPEDLANIIYTSGSSGEPKGVMVLHKGVMALSRAAAEVWELNQRDSRMLQFSSHCFDASTVEIFATLCSGATLVLGSRDELLPGPNLARYIDTHKVTAALLPPSVLSTLNEFSSELTCLRAVIAGGEACTLALASTWALPGRRFINAYGPTECTVVTTMHVIDDISDLSGLSTVPLGAPLPGWTVDLLDSQLEPVEDGEVGQIYIGGVGVSAGYFGKPKLTSECFIIHPRTGQTLYRSGDLGVRRGSRKLLEFAGRVDTQIKIRGFRVELGAVEQTLCQHLAVEHAAVTAVAANKDGSNQILVAYVVLRREAAESKLFSSSLLKSFLLDHLPSYMVPHVYVIMTALPLTLNGGKVDRKALPHPVSLQSSSPVSNGCCGHDTAVDGLDDDLHGMLSMACLTFANVLGLDGGLVKVDSNFFDLGGNSLLLMPLLSELRQTFEMEMLSREIYNHPTPQQLVRLILTKRKQTDSVLQLDAVRDVLNKESQSLDRTLRALKSGKLRSRAALVTGATGFLGVFLLDNLLAQSPFQVIYCLVRGNSVAQAWEKLGAARQKYGLATRISNVQLVLLVGDIQELMLGRSEESYAQLCQHVDTIYHVAAVTNYLWPYEEIGLPNVVGTKNILHFAANGISTKTLHYVSTVGVYGSLSAFSFDLLDENFDMECCPSFFSNTETGYSKSKWVAEMMVLDFRSRGFPVSIYRPGFIQAHSVTGAANRDDMMCRYIQGCIQMGKYPHLPRKFWIPVSVDFVADAISYISLNTAPGQIYNLVPDREREMGNSAMFQTLKDVWQYKLEELGFPEWLEALSSVPSSNSLYPVLSYLSETDNGNNLTPLEMPTATFGFTNTREVLRGSDIIVPSFERSHLEKYVGFMQN